MRRLPRRHPTSVALLALLALWLQLLAPALALGMRARALEPATTICHADTSTHHVGDRRAPPPRPCDHCLACHAMADVLAAGGRPAYVLLDHPVTSPLRWTPRIGGAAPLDLRPAARPRGPPAVF